MKGIYNKRPNLPRYSSTWDVNKVFELFRSWHPPRKISLRQLSMKTAVLLLILSGRRGGSIVKIQIEDLFFEEDMLTIKISELSKTSSANHHEPDIQLKSFSEPALCPVNYIKEYKRRTQPARSCSQLLISFKKPFKGISRDTLSRWTKQIMQEAKVDTNLFKPHSVRVATTSKALEKDFSLATVMRSIGWKKAETVAKYYAKPIDHGRSLDEVVLEEQVR